MSCRIRTLSCTRLFARADFAAANAAIALSNLAMYTTLLAVPILLLRRSDWSSVEGGLVLAVMSLGMLVFSPVGGRLADRVGRRGPTVAGLALIGVGVGLSSAGLQAAAVEAVEPEHAGVASGIFSTSRYLGSIVGSGVLVGFMGPAGSGTAGGAGVFLLAGGAAFLSVLTVSIFGQRRG